MKILTLTQPWATLVANGAKTIETRSWSTSYRGRIAIHAAAGLGPVGGERGLCELVGMNPMFRAALVPTANRGDFWETVTHAVERLPRGAIVAVADLVECCPTACAYARDSTDEPLDLRYGGYIRNDAFVQVTAQERAFGDYGPGRFAWLLANVRPLRAPLPYRGAQGLCPVTPEVTALIEAQL